MKPHRAVLAVLPLALPFALAGALAASSAVAQEDATSDADPGLGATAEILGEWGFEASPTHPGCDFTGDITIRPSPTPGVYQCSIVARDYCPDIWDFRAEQTCLATRDGASLSIESTIDSVEPPTDSYWPDNFSLTIIDGANMVGQLDSVIIADARFFRRQGPIS